ncbi:leucyl-tRNA synthetase [Amniculicola lignicola CBS 123094]|uniref:leucine--tRNA ligase n=1 Tax=Amniculicola lignicola CBS 123094 TaxID=1392246 RepID=A0A6A5WNV9_9PLEO|nr:leucyl-tRNA synthetase [Amniculicola lignicola CBS 123094]
MVMLARRVSAVGGSCARPRRPLPQHHPPRRLLGGGIAKEVKFNLRELDKKWHARSQQPRWHRLREPTEKTAYVLPMFPYPSGTLHLGHLRVYTISDVLARFKQMQGYHVLHPIGWDAFGLPAENAAIEHGMHPKEWTMQNISAMKKQLRAMGGRFEWNCELHTSDPNFYKHTQHIFLMLYKRGLAYQAEAMVNYDPVDKTVLANEQVDANGCSWRSGAKVEKVMLKQWFLKIKDFQDALLDDLDVLAENGRWPERVLAMQRNWLGKSEGTLLPFEIHTKESGTQLGSTEVFTTRLDTLFGVQYIALSLKHPIVQKLAQDDGPLRAFLDRPQDLPQDSKEGYLLPGIMAKNPAGVIAPGVALDVPVYVAPYVLDDYGSGAVMGVPGNDTRDHAFWRANTENSSIKQVIIGEENTATKTLFPDTSDDRPIVAKGFVGSDVPEIGGLTSDEAMNAIFERLHASSVTVEKKTNWRLKDWLISRQRYWGTPIPIIHCASCGTVPVPRSDLPVRLPDLPGKDFQKMTGNPLAEDPNWKICKCPKCGSGAERETDTMDTFMDSSWYFFRFPDVENMATPIQPTRASANLPVDIYVGGVEHAILHLLYARFISKFLATTPYWPDGTAHHGEPFKHLITQGMVHGKTYSDPETGRFLHPREIDFTNKADPRISRSGEEPKITFEKMSKSKHNGVDPNTTIAKYGADVTRAHMLFQAPVSDVLEWDESKITGVQRWLQRVIRLSKVTFIPPTVMKSFCPLPSLDLPTIELLGALRQKKVLKRPPIPDGSPIILNREEALIASLKPNEQIFWSRVQEITSSVTKSYAESYSLNTIVSDLMTMTNLIWDQQHTSEAMSYLRFTATLNLLRMLAPIAPAVAEEGCEQLLAVATEHIGHLPDHPLARRMYRSVFQLGIPVADLDIIPALNPTTVCVFQVDGKKKFDCKIRTPPIQILKNHKKTQQWVLDQIAATEQGNEWLEMGKGKLWKIKATDEQPHAEYPQLPESWTPVLVKNGKLVNVVSRKMGKGKKDSSSQFDPATSEIFEPRLLQTMEPDGRKGGSIE